MAKKSKKFQLKWEKMKEGDSVPLEEEPPKKKKKPNFKLKWK